MKKTLTHILAATTLSASIGCNAHDIEFSGGSGGGTSDSGHNPDDFHWNGQDTSDSGEEGGSSGGTGGDDGFDVPEECDFSSEGLNIGGNGRSLAEHTLTLGNSTYAGFVFEQPQSTHWVGQWENNLTKNDVQELQLLGARISPIGNHAYDVSFSGSIAELNLSSGNTLTKVVNVKPEDKIDAMVVRGFETNEIQPWVDAVENQTYMIAKFYDDVSNAEIHDAIQNAGGHVFSFVQYKGEKIPGLNAVQYTTLIEDAEFAVEVLSEDSRVKKIQHGAINLTPTNLTGRHVTGTERVQNMYPGLTGSFSLIGNYDGGRGSDMAPFEGRIFYYDENEPTSYHATHTLGSTIGNGAGSFEFYNEDCTSNPAPAVCDFFVDENFAYDPDVASRATQGVAFEAAAVSTQHDGCGDACYWGDPQNLADKFAWFADYSDTNFDVPYVLSIGSSTGSNTSKNGTDCEANGDFTDISIEIVNFIADYEGISINFSAGNETGHWRCQNEEQFGLDHPGWDNVGTPGGAKNIISVGAAQLTDEAKQAVKDWQRHPSDLQPSDLERTGFSSQGPVLKEGHKSGGRGVLITTLGKDVLSPIYATEEGEVIIGEYSGTSMSRPLAQGVQHILMQYAFENGYDETLLRRGEYWRALMSMATSECNNLEDNLFGYPNPSVGYGCVDAERGIEVLQAHQYSIEHIGDGDVHMYELTIGASGGAQVTLVWDDIWTAGENKALINDLDLRVESGSATHQPTYTNELCPWLPEIEGRDSVNTIEQVTIPAGTYAEGTVLSLMVGGYSVTMNHFGVDTERYALVADSKLALIGGNKSEPKPREPSSNDGGYLHLMYGN